MRRCQMSDINIGLTLELTRRISVRPSYIRLFSYYQQDIEFTRYIIRIALNCQISSSSIYFYQIIDV